MPCYQPVEAPNSSVPSSPSLAQEGEWGLREEDKLVSMFPVPKLRLDDQWPCSGM